MSCHEGAADKTLAACIQPSLVRLQTQPDIAGAKQVRAAGAAHLVGVDRDLVTFAEVRSTSQPVPGRKQD